MRFPPKCPYCNKDNTPNCKGKYPSQFINKTKRYYHAELHLCVHCHHPIFLFKESIDELSTVGVNIVQYYPLHTDMNIPALVKKISPNAYKAFCQACQAQELGFDMLVGAGLRIALEWLVYDYLIKLKSHTSSELEGKKLHQLICMVEQYNPSQYTAICAKLIKQYGNDQIHIFKKTDLTDDEIITAFGILFDIMESEIKLLNANNRLQGLPEII